MEPEPIVGTETAHQPFFSPDGRRVGFIPTGVREVRLASLGGEPPVTVVDSGVYRLGASWGEDGYVYFTLRPNGGLARVPDAQGAVELVSTLDTAKGETRHAWPDALPNGKGVLVTVQRAGNAVSEEDDIAVVDLATGETRVLVRGLLGRYALTGHLVFVRFDGAVLAAPFDQDRLELTGPAVPLLGNVTAGVNHRDGWLATERCQPHFARPGRRRVLREGMHRLVDRGIDSRLDSRYSERS